MFRDSSGTVSGADASVGPETLESVAPGASCIRGRNHRIAIAHEIVEAGRDKSGQFLARTDHVPRFGSSNEVESM